MNSWKGDDLKGWGDSGEPIELPEVSADDSDKIFALMRQVPRGTYSEGTLRIYIGKAKGARPTGISIKDIPREIRRVGNRWGITFDIVTEQYLVWGGGEPKKGYVPSYTGIVKPEWELAANDIIRNMPHRVMKYNTFALYFNHTARRIGYKTLSVRYVVDCIIQGRIRVPVIVTDTTIETIGGKAERMIK